jgi:outer membrane lipopolysaccharide assembly protein LptE/RlpB
MNQIINLKILLLIVALLGSIAAGIAWQNKRAAAIDSSMENARRQAIQKYGAMSPAQTRQLHWSDSIRNAKAK